MRSPRWITCRPLALAGLVAILLPLLSFDVRAGEWQMHSTKLSTLSRQIEADEQEVRKLIEHKKHLKDRDALKEVLKEIESKYKSLADRTKDYQEERLHVRFKHPDRDMKEERQYTRHQLKSLDELENELGIDGKLDRVKSRVLVTFPIPKTAKTAAAPPPGFRTKIRKPASEGVVDIESETIVLKVGEPTH